MPEIAKIQGKLNTTIKAVVRYAGGDGVCMRHTNAGYQMDREILANRQIRVEEAACNLCLSSSRWLDIEFLGVSAVALLTYLGVIDEVAAGK